MELYTLDSLFRRNAVIDRFESLIWAERYFAWGDFELVLFSTPEVRKQIVTGVRFALNESYRVMQVESVENKMDSEGRLLLTAKGRTLESILEDRSARNNFVELTAMPKWVLTGTPAEICREIFNTVCRDNQYFQEDQIPFLMEGTLFPPTTIAEPDVVITVELELKSVYKAIKEICEAYNLGFRLVRNFDFSELYFDIYTGSDRTTLQSVLPPVIFSQSLDNLADTTELMSVDNYKNVAYVYHPISVQIVIADGTPTEIAGFDRRVLQVDAKDIEVPERAYSISADQESAISKARGLTSSTDDQRTALDNLGQKKRLSPYDVTQISPFGVNTGLTVDERQFILDALNTSVNYNQTETDYITPLLEQRGKEELAKHRSIAAFDGELPPSSPYKYNVHYNLGDIVEMRNIDGATNQMRVTEQIFVSDAEGERSYPTLVLNLFITAGSWLAWDFNQVWADADGEWVDLDAG